MLFFPGHVFYFSHYFDRSMTCYCCAGSAAALTTELIMIDQLTSLLIFYDLATLGSAFGLLYCVYCLFVMHTFGYYGIYRLQISEVSLLRISVIDRICSIKFTLSVTFNKY